MEGAEEIGGCDEGLAAADGGGVPTVCLRLIRSWHLRKKALRCAGIGRDREYRDERFGIDREYTEVWVGCWGDSEGKGGPRGCWSRSLMFAKSSINFQATCVPSS